MANGLAIAFEPTNIEVGREELSFTVDLDPTYSLEQLETVPTGIFSDDSGLRAIVRYLHDNSNKSFTEIASLLNRHINTIKTSYAKSKEQYNLGGRDLPVAIFSTLPPLEAAASYLQKQGMRLTDIAHELGRDPRTIWTVLDRVKRRKNA